MMDGLPAFLLGSFPSEIRLNTIIKAVSTLVRCMSPSTVKMCLNGPVTVKKRTKINLMSCYCVKNN